MIKILNIIRLHKFKNIFYCFILKYEHNNTKSYSNSNNTTSKTYNNSNSNSEKTQSFQKTTYTAPKVDPTPKKETLQVKSNQNSSNNSSNNVKSTPKVEVKSNSNNQKSTNNSGQ